jgi:hypothetical protein
MSGIAGHHAAYDDLQNNVSRTVSRVVTGIQTSPPNGKRLAVINTLMAAAVRKNRGMKTM